MSQITTHVLDTSRGVPAPGIRISLQRPKGASWETIASGVTNEDGRISDLLEKDTNLATGTYRMFFETKPYYDRLERSSFYPRIPIIFEINDSSHYHIPLLLSPYGYTTYRGS